MSIFDISNFERQGNTENDQLFSNLNEIEDATVELASNALRSIYIFTPDLQRDIYDNDRFREALIKFARGNRHAQIKILLADSSSAVHHGHRIIRLSQQLTSAMQIRTTPEDYRETHMSFIMADQTDFIFKPDYTASDAIYAHCKHRGNKLMEFFTPAWDQAEIDPQTRRISL